MAPLGKTSRIANTDKAHATRLDALLRFDEQLREQKPHARYLVGLDEVGRGSLIGNVVGGAVCFPMPLDASQQAALKRLNDSKKLDASTRAALSQVILEVGVGGLGEANPAEIERLNIHYASLLAVYRAFCRVCEQLGVSPQGEECFVVMDGRALVPDLPMERQRAIIKGDGQSAVIAAASVIAKHHRDSRIIALAREYPGYGWEANMGYPTPGHRQGIREQGLTPLHRKNFRLLPAEQGVLPFSSS